MAGKLPAEGHELRRDALHAAALRRLRRKERGEGSLTFPAVPSLCAHYQQRLIAAFAALGRPANKQESDALGEMLQGLIREAWKESPYSQIVAHYETAENPNDGINYRFETMVISVADAYDRWVETRPKPFFGVEPNAKVLRLARSLGTPNDIAVLDVGAAEGRNTLPLAREGFATDAVELSPEFAKLLHQNLLRESLGGRVFMGDFLDSRLEIPKDHYDLIVLAGVVVAHFRSPTHLRALMARACELLRRGGVLLFNVFVTLDGFEPGTDLRELGELYWTVMFTPPELDEVFAGLPLQRTDDASFVEYEREHAPESWPPTDYFEAYCAAQDLFDLPAGRAPLEMRWLTYRKD